MPSSPCGRCGRILDFSGDPPAFCAYCGHSLSAHRLAVTAEFSPDPNRTSGAGTDPDPGGRPGGPPPDQIASYRIIRRIGDGGMGAVFEAEDTDQGRRVAIKVLANRFDIGPESIERFRQEGRLASTIAHPRCVFVLAADEVMGQPYIVMELMNGSTLQHLVEEQGPLDPTAAVVKILDVIDGLIEAHRLGLIHRDVKPSNCFLEDDGRVKVGDFGLSKSLGNPAHLTRTGAFVGTPLYASPEQIKGGLLDERTDVYSVAATLYFLLTGHPPFEAPDAAATLARIVSENPIPPRDYNPAIPAGLETVLLRAMDRDRDRRVGDLEELREELIPFSPAPLPGAELGGRAGAFAIDLVALILGESGVALGLRGLLAALGTGMPAGLAPIVEALTTLALWGIYFGVGEGVWGRTPGKRLFRVRVQEAAANRPPGVGRALARVAVFFLIQFVPVLAGHHLFLYFGARWGSVAWVGAYALTCLVLLALGALGTLSTMSERNGFRGPHELASGTRSVRPPRRHVRVDSIARRMLGRDRGVVRPVGVLHRVGPYKVRGAVRWEADRRVLSAQDSSLGREVWVVLRPRDREAPSVARRELVRPNRPRWLSGGVQPEGRWDAFVAPAGCPLADLAGPEGLPWPEVKPVLRDLSAELAASCADGTLPPGLHSDQVWIEPDGRFLLVDPLGESSAVDAPALDPGKSDPRALRLFASVSALALEGGRRRLGDTTTPVRAAVPLHARQALDRLFGIGPPYPSAEDLRLAFEAHRELPTTLDPVTRAFRIVSFVASVPLRLGAAFLVVRAIEAAGFSRAIPTVTGGLGPEQLLLYGSILFWIVLAGIGRGRLVSRALGVALVDPDGRPPGAWRCMLREALVWGPPLLLLLGGEALLTTLPAVWTSGALAWFLRFAPLGWVVLDASHELMSPGQALHDRLSGTRMVPR
jgi:hypothetical protein